MNIVKIFRIKIIKALILFVIPYLLLYVPFSIFCGSADPQEWESNIRAGYTTIAGILSVIAFVFGLFGDEDII